jgi:hypothetical protein
MENLKIINNFLTNDEYENIYSLVNDHTFPWYKDYIINPSFINTNSVLECEEKYNFQFIHQLYLTNEFVSKYCIFFNPILKKLNVKKLYTMKLNLNPISDKIISHSYHTDNDLNCRTSVYYLNTNNGFTIFENKMQVQSEQNKLISFPSSYKHTGTTSTTDHRIVLNINYISGINNSEE